MSWTWLRERAAAVRRIRVIERDAPVIDRADLSQEPFLGPGRHGGQGPIDIIEGSDTCRERIRRRRQLERALAMPREGVGRLQPLERVNLAVIDGDLVRRGTRDEERGGESNGADRRRRPVNGVDERGERDRNAGLFTRLADSGAAGGGKRVSGKVRRFVPEVDPASWEDPVIALEGERRVTPEEQNLQAAGSGAEQHH